MRFSDYAQCSALLAAIALTGCAVGTAVPTAPIDRLTPEQLAAIPLPGPEQAAEATRLTRQADREALEAKEAKARREREYLRWRNYERYPPWPHPYGPPYSRFGGGGWYGYPW